MILEYLFSEPTTVQDKIKSYAEAYDSIDIEIKDVKDTQIWLVSFKVNSEDDNCALTLSKVNEEIIGKYNVITLTNEAAFYYNKMLYPLINEFERDLRKLLYLASKLSNDSSDSEIIHNLEEMVFGDLFDLIFTDKEFINSVKKTVNKKSWNYNKDEIISDLKEIEENTLWKKLLSVKIAPILQKNYRNSVMHAHNITTEDYLHAKEIYSTVIRELSDAIDDIVNNKIDFNNIQNFNNAIVVAIDNERMCTFTDSTGAYKEQLKGKGDVYSLIYNDLADLKNDLPTTIKNEVYKNQEFELKNIVNAFQQLLDLGFVTGNIDQNENLYVKSFQSE